MGYNSIISFRNSDLDRMAADPSFGKNLFSLMMMGSSISSYRKIHDTSGLNPFRPATMCDLAFRGIRTDYDVSVAEPLSSETDRPFAVLNGQIYPIDFFRADLVPIWQFRIIAEKMRDFGMDTMLRGTFTTVKKPARHIPADDKEFMGGWKDFDRATTTIMLMHDNADRLNETDIGEKLRDHVRNAWSKLSAGAGKEGYFLRGIPTSGKILAFTPADETDLVMGGGNTGYAVRPWASAMEARNAEAARAEAIGRVRKEMLDAGFSVKYQSQRMSPPTRWNKKHWVNPANHPEKSS